uniref:Tail protein n=1 Tax=Siphoviridae sp. ctfR912 TaxID=2825596 RepID=A0A8S5Q972_9CAUD|nr:MAG TPA: tail protein [Siphoviridae sp. ctfR912]DAQ11647.1 MAG TPA: tail protein [Caudoviricetes sp.]
MITLTDREYNKLCQLHFGSSGGLIAYNDWFEQDLDTGIGTYEFTVDKTGNPEIEKINVGCYLMVKDGSKLRSFEIMRIEEDKNSKTIYAEDAGLDLLGEQVPPYKADKSYPITHYIEEFTFDSGWEVGTNEIPATTTRKLEWEGTETATKRLLQLVKRFDAEISYDFEFLNDKIYKKLIHIHKRIGEDKKVRLEVGREASNVKRTISIENLATTIVATGADGITLAGAEYNEGNIRSSKNSIYLIDYDAVARWKRAGYAPAGGGIVKRYESEAKTPQSLMVEAVIKLKQWNHPEVTYDVPINILPREVNIGDTVVIVDHHYEPALIVSGRVSSIKKSLATRENGEIKITNIQSKEDTISEKVRRLSTLVQERLFDFTSVPFVMTIQSTDGVVFQNSNISTKLVANVSKMDIQMNSRFTYRWKRVSKYGTDDAAWNEQHASGSNELSITVSDVDREATFICEAIEGNQVVASSSIVIKDFIVNKSIGPTPPTNPSVGDLWTDTSTPGKDVPKIYTNGKWEPVLKKDDEEVERLQKEFEDRNREHANQFAEVMEIINKSQVTEDTLRDLTGKFSSLEESYKRIQETAEEIKGLGQRTKAVELNMEQSSVLLNAISTYFNVSEDGLLIGKNGEKLQTRYTNERMEFIDSGRVVAYISGQQLNIVSATFWNSVTIANHIFERYDNEFTVISYVGGAVNG